MFSAEKIKRRFLSLTPSKNAGVLELKPLAGNFFVCRSSEGNAALAALVDPGRQADFHRVLHGISLRLCTSALVKDGFRKPKVSPLVVLECLDPEKLRIFSVLTAEIREQVTAKPAMFRRPGEILAYIGTWAEMFAPLPVLSKEAQIGLWGELDLLMRLPSPRAGLEAWRGCEGSTFDFSATGLHLEVKTAASKLPHRFSLAQLSAPGTSRVFVWSLRIQEDSASGQSLDEKVASIRKLVGDDYLLEKKLLMAGYNEGSYAATRYSVESFKMIPGIKVPQPVVSDERVQGVIFKSDLSTIAGLPSARTAAVLRTLCRSAPT